MIAEHGISRSAQAGRLQEAVEVICRDKTRTKLTLNLEECKELKDVTPLAKLGELQSLQKLELTLSGCKQLVDVTGLAKLGGLQSLQDFSLGLSGCKKLPESLQKMFTNKPKPSWVEEADYAYISNITEFAAACKGGADGHEGGDPAEWPA